MKKINKSGFTMVELLATIVIIGILGTIGVVGVTKSMKSAKDRYYVAQNKLFISAAQTYFTDNKSRLPMHEPLSKKVMLKTLNEENYIEKMVDYNKEPYNGESYVKVTKLGLNLYSYEGTLIDSKGTVQEYKESGEEKASVIFTVDDEQFSNKSDKKYTNKEKTVNIEIIDNDGIAGYVISIQKQGKTVNEMDYIGVGGATSATNKVTIATDKYGDGEYSVSVKVYDKYNDQKRFTSGKIVVDTIAPKCKYKGNSTTWKNTPRIIKYTGEDELSGIDTTTEQQKKYGEGNTVLKTTNGIKYTIKDKAGNSIQCDYTNEDINVYYDKEPPACTYSGESTSWAKSRTIIVGCNDNSGSGCANNTGNAILFEGKTITTSSISGTIKDKAGNEKSCSKQANAYIDNTAPTVPQVKLTEYVDGTQYTYKNDTWTRGYVVATASGSTDKGSGVNKYLYTTTGKTENATDVKLNANGRAIKAYGISYIKIKACDKVGNCSEYSGLKTIKIDNKPPTITYNTTDSDWNKGFNQKTIKGKRYNTGLRHIVATDEYNKIKTIHYDKRQNNGLNLGEGDYVEASIGDSEALKNLNTNEPGTRATGYREYKATGKKWTVYIACDVLGNCKRSRAKTDEVIECVCRKKSDGEVVHDANASPSWNCENAHGDYRENTLFLSCS